MVSIKRDGDVFLLLNFSCCTDLHSGFKRMLWRLCREYSRFQLMGLKFWISGFFFRGGGGGRGGGVGKFGKYFLGGLIN